MADWLILRMTEDAGAAVTWFVCDPAARLLSPARAGTLAEAAVVASGRRVVVLAPASSVLITAAELPAKANPAKLAQIVPFALEEQLADDVEALHFALGKRPAEGARTPVAVVAKALIADWLARLASAGIVANALYGEADLLPAVPGQTTALLEGDAITIRRLESAPIVLPADALAEAFDLADGPASPHSPRMPMSLMLYASPEDWMRREADAEALHGRYSPFQVQLLPNGPLPLLAQTLVQGGGIDLLQGAYAPARSRGAGLGAWKVAAILALCLIGLHAASEALALARLKRAERELDAATVMLVRSALPAAAPGGDLRRILEAQLAAVRNSAGGVGFLPALEVLAQAHAAAPQAAIESLSFGANALQLKVTAPDAATLDRMSQRLRSGGWTAELTAAGARAPGSAGYEGRIQMKAAGGPS
jgi:general secretion pathway protein L